jgi:hypothetical protein
MLSRITALVIALLFFACTPIKKLYVDFGAAKKELARKNDGVTRIYFDRYGALYPDIDIADALMRKHDSRLESVYQNEPEIRKQVQGKYGLPQDFTTEALQQKLVRHATSLINLEVKGKELVFLIHGFNKHPLLPGNSSASVEFGLLRQAITSQFSQRRFHFVEIYWDGCSWANGPKRLTSFNTFKVWDNAEPASNNVGLELRRILYGLEHSSYYVVSHSLGAGVVTCALFNVEKFPPGEFMREIKSLYSDTVHYRTPVAKVKVGMLAPAIPGENTFNDYEERTPASVPAFNDSYVVGFNRYDPALTKVIGLAKYAGATTLGCLPSEYTTVQSMMNKNGHKVIDSTDFSFEGNGARQKKHEVGAYTGNARAMANFLDKVFH